MGFVETVCISAEKGIVKTPVERVTLRPAWGIEGDAHAGAWHRQVSLLAAESIDRMRERIPWIGHGMFAENIVTRGCDFAMLRIGDSLLLGDEVLLEVTQIGKECHNGECAIGRSTGECIMPREGIFCIVLAGGTVMPGMKISGSPGKPEAISG